MLGRLFKPQRQEPHEIKNDRLPQPSKGKILLVDDDPHLRELIRLTLEGKGYTVREGQDGSEVGSLVREWSPDLVVLDGNMPNMDGFDALKQLRTHRATAKLPVIMLTMRSTQVDMLTGYRFGAQEYLTKPIALEQLVVAVKRLLGTR
jgi:two-component system, OmpR family, response regulator